MGRRLDGFDIELTFDASGEVDTVAYADGDGCGHSALFSDPNTKLRDVVEYHLNHYKRSHKMSPKRMCGFTLDHQIDPHTKYICHAEPHTGNDHEFTMKKVKV